MSKHYYTPDPKYFFEWYGSIKEPRNQKTIS